MAIYENKALAHRVQHRVVVHKELREVLRAPAEGYPPEIAPEKSGDERSRCE